MADVSQALSSTVKYYRPDAALNLPLYLDADVDAFMRQLAGKTGKDVQKLVNEWLRSNIILVESAQQPTPRTIVRRTLQSD
jgi:hypothetical protein